MKRAEAINRIIGIAENEIGYLEKRNNYDLDSKTGNAGSSNYTKYWRDVKPSYQGEPWCACFVTWCFDKAFGKDLSAKLLRHYPYVYCPTMSSLFTLNANPSIGDIVVFKRNGTFVHTGLVVKVNGDYFETVEGNTSGGSSIIANGGGVFRKSYYNSNLPGTKFVTVDWGLLSMMDVPSEQSYYAKAFYELLIASGIITDKKFWSLYEESISKAYVVQMVDNATGGLWTSEETDSSVHWCQPAVISLCGKHIITDKNQWLNNPDMKVSKALLLALIDNATGGMLDKYKNRKTDHWGRNHLDSLCDKEIINTPAAWIDFNSNVTRGSLMAVICKAFLI